MSTRVGTNNCHFSYADGISQPLKGSPSRDRAPSAASSALSRPGQRTPSRSPSPPRTPSHVQWIPLSPQSSQTLLRHRATKSRENVDDEDGAADDNDSAVVPARRRFRKRRRNSDPSANRPVHVGRHRNELPESDRSESGGEEEVEVLPDRFDGSGRPIDPNAPSSSRSARVRGGWTERHGDFEYRSPRPGGTQARGMWSVGGTDPDQVERMMQDVTGIIGDGPPKGVSGWIGLAGRLLGSGILGAQGLPGPHDEEHDNGEPDNGGGRRGGGGRSRDVDKVGYGGSGSEISRDERGKGRRRVNDHDDTDDVDEDDGMRRRRRRKRREVE